MGKLKDTFEKIDEEYSTSIVPGEPIDVQGLLNEKLTRVEKKLDAIMEEMDED